MALPVFPNIEPPSHIYEEEPEDRGMRSEMKSGLTIGRARYTKSRLTFNLHWTAIPAASKAKLLAFYRDVVGGTASNFIWTHNQDDSSEFHDQSFTVYFASPPKFKAIAPGYWSAEAVLKEA